MNIVLDEQHNYFVDNLRKPGVSEIVSHFGFSDFSMIPEHIMKPAKDFGNVIHEVIKLSERGDIEGFNNDHFKILKHWEDFKKSVELKDCIVDIKTNASKKPSIGNMLQLFGYRVLINTCLNKALWLDKPVIEQKLYSDIWDFCGTPDYFNIKSGIKKLYIVCISMDGFKPFIFDTVKDNQWENEFKCLLKVYQMQKREGII